MKIQKILPTYSLTSNESDRLQYSQETEKNNYDNETKFYINMKKSLFMRKELPKLMRKTILHEYSASF